LELLNSFCHFIYATKGFIQSLLKIILKGWNAMQNRVLGIYSSPRKAGNTDQILDKALEGAIQAGAEIKRIYARDLSVSGCLECGGCDKTGKCIVRDDMDSVYPLLESAGIIFLASPIFFYALPAQVKALVDRTQAMWSRRRLEKSPAERKFYNSGKGYLIAVGATRGKNLFEGVRLEARYFFDALDMSYEGGLFFRGLEKSTDIQQRPELLEEAFSLGERVFCGS
jgi:multimeric flavodoxin WrbA